MRKVYFKNMRKGFLYGSPSGLAVYRFRKRGRNGDIKEYLYVPCTDHFLSFNIKDKTIFREIGPYKPNSRFLELEKIYGGKVLKKAIKRGLKYLKKHRPQTIYNSLKRKFRIEKVR